MGLKYYTIWTVRQGFTPFKPVRRLFTQNFESDGRHFSSRFNFSKWAFKQINRTILSQTGYLERNGRYFLIFNPVEVYNMDKTLKNRVKILHHFRLFARISPPS